MKKWIAVFCTGLLLFAFAACGAQEDPALQTEAPSVGRIDEKESFYVYIPEDWCKMEYRENGQILRLFNTRSAVDIQDDTAEIMIEMQQDTAENTDAALQKLLAQKDAEELPTQTIGGYDFRCVTYPHSEGRDYTVLVGLVGGHITRVTLKGLPLDGDEAVRSVIDSIYFK